MAGSSRPTFPALAMSGSLGGFFGSAKCPHAHKEGPLWQCQVSCPKSPPYMGMGTLCTAKEGPLYGHGDTLHCQKGPSLWAWGHFALPKRALFMGMGTLGTAQKAPHIWAWGHFALPKRALFMGMGTLGTAKEGPLYGHGDTLHCQKGPSLWVWGHLALPKKPPIYGHGDTLHCLLAVPSVPMPIKRALFSSAKCPHAHIWGAFCSAKCPHAHLWGAFCSAKCPHTHKEGPFWQCKVSPCPFMGGFWQCKVSPCPYRGFLAVLPLLPRTSLPAVQLQQVPRSEQKKTNQNGKGRAALEGKEGGLGSCTSAS